MDKIYLQISNLPEVESLRQSFLSNLNLQTMDANIRADLQIEFEDWLNNWIKGAYRTGIIPATVPLAQG